MNVIAHAVQITNDLATTVAAFEMRCANVFARPVPDSKRLESAIRVVWPQLITDAQNFRVSPDARYVASLFDRLTNEIGGKDPGAFRDRTDIPWLEYYTAGCGDESRCEDGWVIAEIFWGGYVNSFHLTLGWLLMNAIRIQQRLPAIVPTLASLDRFTDYLRWSGPDSYDAENLRGLFYEYEDQMGARQSGG
jgi:hypothetical protein